MTVTLHVAGWAAAVVDDAELDGLLLVDDAEARRVVDDDAAVALVVVAGEEHVQRRGGRQGGAAVGDVVDLAVGQHDDGADALRRHVGKRRRQRAEQLGAVDRRAAVWAAGLDGAHLDVVERGEALLQRRRGRGRRLVAPVEPLAGALVDDQRDDGGQRLAVLVEEHRVGQRQQQRQRRGGAKPRAAACGAAGRE